MSSPTLVSSPNRRVVVVGAGAAGVFTAYRLREMYGGIYDIELLEASGRVGGNTFTTHLEFGEKWYSIDCGAQFFYRNPQASYVELLEQLGLFDADDQREIVSAAAGFTIWDRRADARVFYVPSRLGGLLHYDDDDWERLIAFGTYLAYSFFLDRGHEPWTTSVDEWLGGLHLLGDDFKENVIKRFMYQFVTLPPGRIGEASARYAVTYFVRNVFGEPRVDEPDPSLPSLPGLPLFETYQSLIGLDGVLERALAAAGVAARLDHRVDRVTRTSAGFEVHTAGGNIDAGHVVLACDPQTSADILAAGGADPALVATLRRLEYVKLPISMQKEGSCYMPGDQKYWEPVNTIVDGDKLLFSAWFGPLRAKYDGGKQIPVFKSWGSPELAPLACGHEFLAHEHRVLQPTTAFMQARAELAAWQGTDGLWFAGGWTNWFDSQEAALDSATRIADALPGEARAETGLERMVAHDHERQRKNLRRWLERVARRAPDEKRERLANVLSRVEHEG
jgi:predicted NAD/FAD-binding protein